MNAPAITRWVKAAAAALALIVPTSACARTPHPIPKGTDTFYYGYIVSGEKFGVKIGDSRGAARAVLSARYEDYGQSSCGSWTHEVTGCSDVSVIDMYRVRQFLRDGLIYLEIDSDQVTGIIWDFGMLPSWDM